MTGLQAVDRGIAKQQRVAVGAVGRWRAFVVVLLGRVVVHVLGKFLHQALGQDGQVARRGQMAGLGQAFGVLVARAFHAQGLGLFIHQAHEVFQRTTHAFGQRHGRVVARLDDHALDQVVDGDLHLGVDEHARAGHLPGAFADREALLERDFLGAQRVKHQIAGHQLGQRGLLDRRIDVLRTQHLVGGDVDQQVVAGGDFGGRGQADLGQRKCGHKCGRHCHGNGNNTQGVEYRGHVRLGERLKKRPPVQRAAKRGWRLRPPTLDVTDPAAGGGPPGS